MDNRKFWNDRYSTYPQVGSGPGSRGYAAQKKKFLIRQVITEFRVQTILDIGCGDMCWMDEGITALCRYQGYDISEVIVARNRIAYPSLDFAIHDIVAAPTGKIADLVICFDLLIHQIDEASFRAALTHTLAAIGRVGLLSYQAPPLPDGTFPPPEEPDADPLMLMHEIQFKEEWKTFPWETWGENIRTADCAFHGVLANRIAALRPDLEVSIAASYRNHLVYMVKRESMRHRLRRYVLGWTKRSLHSASTKDTN